MVLRAIHDGQKIEVKFFHQEQEPGWIESHTGICVDDNRRCSMATVSVTNIMKKSDGVSETTGISVCNPIDNFCRAIGRKRALRDALHSLDKGIRCAVWDEYEIQMGF